MKTYLPCDQYSYIMMLIALIRAVDIPLCEDTVATSYTMYNSENV